MVAQEPRWRSTPRLAAAFSTAQLAHDQQSRKNDTRDPYISHLMAVAALVIEHGGTEEQAIIALLHDTIEDTNFKYDALKELFGEQTAEAVRHCSDTEVPTGVSKGPYADRKIKYLKDLASMKPSEITFLVKLADKTHNCESTARNWLMQKHATATDYWHHFNAGDACQEKWYRGLAAALTHVANKEPIDDQMQLLLERFRAAVATLFDGRTIEECGRDHEHLPSTTDIDAAIAVVR